MGVQRLGTLLNGSMIINEVSLKRNNNDKSMKMSKRTQAKINYTEYLADRLVDIYSAPSSRKFFLKCAWHLSEDTIWTAVEISRRGKDRNGKKIASPVRYFVAVCNKALKELS